MRLTITAFSLLLPHAPGFAPAPSHPKHASSTLEMVKEKHHREHPKWFFADLEGLRNWFDKTNKAVTKNLDKAVDVKKDWVAKELNKVDISADNKLPIVAMATDDHVLVEREEFMLLGEDDPFPGDLEEPFPGALPEKMEESLPSDTMVEPAFFKKTPVQAAKTFESRYAWIQRDMEMAGRAETESDSWVAADMESSGRVEERNDWVARDMVQAGKAVSEIPKHKKTDKKTKSRNELIAEDMIAAGKSTGDDWVARDMQRLGRGDVGAAWTKKDKLKEALDKSHDVQYDDIFDDMKKTGMQGSDKTEWVRRDMEATGRAVDISDRLDSLSHAETYELPKLVKKAYDSEALRKDIEAYGRAEARDWVKANMTHTGHSEHQGWTSSVQDKDLADWVNRNKKVADDMINEGKARPGFKHKDNKVSRDKLNDLIANDMKKMGKATTSADSVVHDMEMAGDPEDHMIDGIQSTVHQKRETEEFMKSRKTIRVPWVETLREAELHGYHPVEEDRYIYPIKETAEEPVLTKEVSEIAEAHEDHYLYPLRAEVKERKKPRGAKQNHQGLIGGLGRFFHF